MYKSNKQKDFNPIEFSRRGPRSASERQNIRKGLKKFWDKKGRAVLTVGAAGTAAGGLLLAARSGRLPTGKAISNVKQKVMSGKAAQKMLPPASGVNSQPRLLPGSSAKSNIAKTVPGVSSKNIVTQVAQTTGGASGRAYGAGKATRAAMQDGYKTAKASDPAYRAGRAVFKNLTKVGKAAKRATRRRK